MRLAPRAAATAIASTRTGKARNMSVPRDSPWSTAPPRKPATAPTRVPTAKPMATTATAAGNDVRPPFRTRLKTSRPSWSVPKKWSGPGGRRRFSRCWLIGSGSPSIGANTMRTAKRTMMNRATASSASRRRPSPRGAVSLRARTFAAGSGAAAPGAAACGPPSPAWITSASPSSGCERAGRAAHT